MSEPASASSESPDAEVLDDTDEEDFEHDAALAAYEERLAVQRASAIAAGRRKGGLAGAAMAGAMLAVSDIIEGPPKEDAPVTVEAPSDPHDLEKDGFGATVDGVDVEAPPLERVDPVTNRKPRR
jgi:hypothetical protein